MFVQVIKELYIDSGEKMRTKDGLINLHIGMINAMRTVCITIKCACYLIF
jgi:hypothetical protein